MILDGRQEIPFTSTMSQARLTDVPLQEKNAVKGKNTLEEVLLAVYGWKSAWTGADGKLNYGL